jgi:ubiquinone/menaquinone biosynthesis C-methylase UbiE
VTFDPEIAAYYGRGEEAARLQTVHRLELVRTQALLERYLPPPPARVLDVGGGPGAYAVWLIERGYDVELVDPVELHVEQAQTAGVSTARLGDARELPFGDESADAVLLLGPLYHLPEAGDRRHALDEARRVLHPGGRLAAAAISRFAPMLDGLYRELLLDPEFEAGVARSLRDGHHTNPDRHRERFTTAYFHLAGDLAAEVRAAGFELTALVGVEGPAAFLRDMDAWLDDPGRQAVLLRALERLENEPSLLGVSPHLLAVGSRYGVGR